MYHDLKFVINKNHHLFSYLENVSVKANNLYNAALFRQRQVMTATAKLADGLPVTDNEQDIMTEIEKALPSMPKKFSMPRKGKWALSYLFMNSLLKVSKNPDYFCKDLPRQCAQHIIMNACSDMKSFRKATSKHKKDPSSFTGKPKLPGYHTKGGCCTFYFTNQECKKKGSLLTFPLTKLTLELGDYIKDSWRLKQVTVKPYYDCLILHAIFDDRISKKECTSESSRICAIDLGVSNFAAVSNNIGMECLLFKGGAVKSINHKYNKEYAKAQSEQTKGSAKKFVSTPEVKRLSKKRDAVMDDFMHKTAKRIITWCIQNSIDTVVVGENKGWKQNSSMSRKENQNFVQIPYKRFKDILEYLCFRNGIKYVLQEESYTSQASFPDNDFMPVYKPDNEEKYSFSGKRGPTAYKGMKKKNGFRGIYRTKDGTDINADLNGSANIGRKAFPELFLAGTVCFDNVKVFKHQDMVV